MNESVVDPSSVPEIGNLLCVSIGVPLIFFEFINLGKKGRVMSLKIVCLRCLSWIRVRGTRK